MNNSPRGLVKYHDTYNDLPLPKNDEISSNFIFHEQKCGDVHPTRISPSSKPYFIFQNHAAKIPQRFTGYLGKHYIFND